MSDADVGKPLLASRMPSPHDFAPQPIDWRKVATKLSSDAEISRTEMMSGKHPPEVMMVAGCVAEILASLSRAIEDGLS